MEVPTSRSMEPAEPVLPDPEIYSLTEPYPASPVEVASVGTMAGRRIASIKVFPLQYVPAERKLAVQRRDILPGGVGGCRRLGPVGAPRDPQRCGPQKRHSRQDGRECRRRRGRFPARRGASGQVPTAVEYLLICHENHVDEFAPLLEWKTRKGVPAAIKTWQEMTATYPGRDNAEKFRNCIKDYYLNHSTMWVTISGSSIKAAAYLRGCYCDVYGTVDDVIPCDLYFADLDGTWNSDNDSYWGETTDGTDLYPDVYVGRLPENTGVQCSTAVSQGPHLRGVLRAATPTTSWRCSSWASGWTTRPTPRSTRT